MPKTNLTVSKRTNKSATLHPKKTPRLHPSKRNYRNDRCLLPLDSKAIEQLVVSYSVILVVDQDGDISSVPLQTANTVRSLV